MEETVVLRNIWLGLLVVLGSLLGVAGGQAAQAAPAVSSPSPLHAVGNHFVNAAGQTVQLQGVVLSEFEYTCTDYHGLYAASSYPALRAWHINAVKIPINPDFWQSCGAAYQQAEYAAIDTALGQDMYVLLTSQASQGGAEPAPTQATITMWQAVAARYRGQGAVLYETFSEPHGPEDNNGNLWVNGGQGYVGQNQIVATIQGADPGALVFPNSPEYGGVAGKYVSEGWHVANATGYSVHLYDNGGNANASAWPGNFGNLSQTMPIVAGEFGSNTGACDAPFLRSLMSYMQAHIAGWFAWEWNPDSANYCGRPALLIDSNASLASGAPSPYGQPIHDYYVADGLGGANAGYAAPATTTTTTTTTTTPPTGGTTPPTTTTTSNGCTQWYTVQPGDFVVEIAARFHVSAWAIIAWNHLANPNLIFPGNRFCVASSAPVPPAPPPTTSPPPVSTSGDVPLNCDYTVRAGDWLAKIAAQAGTTWQVLAALNGLTNPGLIFPGQHLSLCAHSGGGAQVTTTSYTPVGGTAVNRAAFGWCVWYAQTQRMDIQLRGDAWQEATNAATDGYRTGNQPQVGALVVFQPGVEGAGSEGHIAYVVAVSGTRIEVREMAFFGLTAIDGSPSGWDKVDLRWTGGVGAGIEYIYGR